MKTLAPYRPWLLSCLLAMVAACSSTGSDGPTFHVNYVLAPVDGGSCRLLDANGANLAGPVSTTAGRATFTAVPRSSSMGQVVCEGGKYKDAATGTVMAAPKLRSHVALDSGVIEATVSPLTELAVRQLAGRSPTADFSKVLGGVAKSFGLEGVDIARQAPTDLNTTPLGADAAGRYGVVLAALSQLQLHSKDSGGNSAAAIIDGLAQALDPNGRFTDAPTRDALADAIEALADNKLLSARIGTTGRDTLRTVFDNLVNENVLAVIDLVDTDTSPTQSGPAHTVLAHSTSTVALIGRNLHLGLDVRLGQDVCTVRDLESLSESEIESEEEVVYADCPARASGSANLTISDQGGVISTTRLAVLDTLPAAAAPPTFLKPKAGGDANVAGQVTAVAPSIDLANNGALSYSQLRSFQVKGVLVELLDRGAGDALIASTSTDDNGNYRFAGVPSGKQVVVRVKAQLLKVPTASSPSQWNFTVRDNTSGTSPKALYALDSAVSTTATGDNTVNLNASLGFDSTGNELAAPASGRQSAAFSILEVVYSAATKLQATDASVNLPELNIYWSVNNVDASGDKGKGQISTSHYASAGDLPGVFILGKANADTDEFDQGVIGHEFGHYLQSVLSYSDNPGGNHSHGEFKDASLAFGEGYGTAVGGLLSGSPYYTDSKGPRQASGSVTDLSKPTAAGIRKGFYSEESVAYVMYNLGLRQGFPAFWRAVSSMRSSHLSATVFAFLNFFTQQNPGAQAAVNELMAAENLRSMDPLGTLPAGAAADPAINEQASQGANDLETIYIPLTLAAGAAPAAPTNLVPNPPSFCVNSKLPGAALDNGLGLSKRFTFTAPYSGVMGLRPVDDKGRVFDDQATTADVRDNTGTPGQLLQWSDGYAAVAVTAGRTYTVKVQVSPKAVFGGNRCGNQFALWWIKAA